MDDENGRQWTTRAHIDAQAERAYRRARLRAWLSAVRGRWGQRLTELLYLPDVRSHIIVRGQHDRGLQLVPLDRIVGSEGRRGDFDRRFAPRSATTSTRWERIERARRREYGLPPVELIQIGEVYFVRDGHHRISVARHAGQQEIEAHVVELTANVPLTTDLDQRDLERKGAQSSFVEESGITREDPSVELPIEASDPTTYDALLEHIDTHRYFMGLEQGVPVSREAASAHAYQTLYRPMIAAIRHWNLRSVFRGLTESALYLRLMDHRHFMTEELGRDPGPDAALVDYVLRYGSRRARRQIMHHQARTHGSSDAKSGRRTRWRQLPLHLRHWLRRLTARQTFR